MYEILHDSMLSKIDLLKHLCNGMTKLSQDIGSNDLLEFSRIRSHPRYIYALETNTLASLDGAKPWISCSLLGT